jgi:hypothetical protein
MMTANVRLAPHARLPLLAHVSVRDAVLTRATLRVGETMRCARSDYPHLENDS